MQCCIQRCSVARSVAISQHHFRLLCGGLAVCFGFESLGVDDVELGDGSVPFEQGGNAADALVSVAIEIPNGVNHVIAVRIQNMGAFVGVASQMNLHNAVGGNTINVLLGVEPVIERADVDVVHVEQDSAVGFLGKLNQKVRFVPGRAAEFQVGGGIFQRDGPFQDLLNLSDTIGGMAQRFVGVGHGQQVVGVHAAGAGPAEVVGDPARVDALAQRLELVQVVDVDGIDAADRHGNTVQYNGVLFGDLV